mgnify:CR=1 FL=1
MSKKVTLKELTLKNFKGIRDLAVKFGEVTTIAGANATGKSTVFDAFTWVLFGKDSNDRTDSGKGAFTVKTVGFRRKRRRSSPYPHPYGRLGKTARQGRSRT